MLSSLYLQLIFVATFQVTCENYKSNNFRVVLGLLRVLGCFGFWFWAPLYTFCVPRGIDGLGFLCMLEALCAVLVYLEVLDAFF
jgi:hypothetical protein